MQRHYDEHAKDLLRLMGFPLGKRDDPIRKLSVFMMANHRMDVNLSYTDPTKSIAKRAIGKRGDKTLWAYF